MGFLLKGGLVQFHFQQRMKQLLRTARWLFLLGWLPAYAQAQSKPDLVVVAPFELPTSVQAGGAYAMSAVIVNRGSNGAQFNCVGYYLSADNRWDATDSYLGAGCQSLLFPGQSGPCSIMGTIPPLTAPGNYFLVLVADPLNAEQEADETNNVVAFALTITAATAGRLPDLELWRPSIAFSATPPGGSTGSFTFVFNRGPGSVSSYEIGFYLSADTVFSVGQDVALGFVTGGSLVANNGTVHSAPVLQVPGTTPPGNYYLLLVADPRNVVAEANETNNSRALALRVTSPTATAAPLSAAAVAVYPNPLRQGATLEVHWPGFSTGQPLQLRLYNALGQLVAGTELKPAARSGYLPTAGLPAGVYTLRSTSSGLTATRRLLID